MKKFLFIIFFIIFFASSVYAVEDEAYVPAITPADLDGSETFFKSPMQMPDIRTTSPSGSISNFDDYAFDSYTREYSEIDPDNMPFFKQMRLRITNTMNKAGEKLDNSNKPFNFSKSSVERLKFWKKKSPATVADIDSETPLITEEGSIANSIQNETTAYIPDSDTISLEGGVNEQVTEKELQLDSEYINFDEETGDIVATGRPVLFVPPQDTKVIADKMTYNQDSNILKGMGNVYVIKSGMPTLADYVEVDMNEESMLMENLHARTDTMIMDAKKGEQNNSLLIFTDGYIHSDKSVVYRMSSRMVGPRFSSMIVDAEDQSLFFGDPTGNKLHFNVEKIYVEGRKNHDVFTMKNIEVRRKGKYWFTWPSLTAYTNKNRDYFEANYPEFGSKRKLGMFIGPGFVFGGPGGSVMKIIPFLNYQHGDFGFGGFLKYRNTYNTTELGYGSAADVFVLKGIQRLDDNLFLQYAANSYMDEWFLGARMPKYMAEIYYDKGYRKKDFLLEGKDLTFRHRVGFGFMEDNDRNYYGERINSNQISTSRLRYMAEVKQSLYSYERPEDRFYFNLGIAMQGSAAVYGTGDTQFIARIGPRAHLQYKNWMQDIGYFQSGYSDETPIPRYDMYRYGHSCLYISEIIRINKYLSVGWSGNINLSDDSPNGKMFQENRFVVALGPDDLKVRLGYDFVRQTTYFGFDVAFDTKGTSINYGRMEIKNPERLGQKDKSEERKLAFAPAARPQAVQDQQSRQQDNTSASDERSGFAFPTRKKPAAKSKVLEYAQVIDIEDPNKETIE